MTLAERLAEALAEGARQSAVYLTGDDRELDKQGVETMTAAAVLIAVTDRDEPGVILTQRPDTMRRHPGQIAFPGGRIDPDDDGPVAAALREAEEEIALPRRLVSVVGAAEGYRTGTGYHVTPIIGVIPPDLLLVPSEAEVAAVFEVPLSFLLDLANHASASAMWQGRERHYYEINWQDRRIWGATAAIIVNLSRRLAWQG